MGRSEPYRGWLRGAPDRSDLVDDRSESFGVLDRHFGHSGRGVPAHGAVSLRAWMPPICNQGALQSCTAHAVAAALGFEHQGLRASRLQLYYLSRAYENQTGGDVGAKLHNAIRAARDHGAAVEPEWPYDETKVADRPTRTALESAGHHKITRYAPLLSSAEYRRCLEQGYPFVIGLRHTDEFWSETSKLTGVVDTPGPDQPTPHAHAVCVIGYAEPCGRARDYPRPGQPAASGLYYEIRNSAGADWGDEGHFWVPAAYLENAMLAGDAWTIRR